MRALQHHPAAMVLLLAVACALVLLGNLRFRWDVNAAPYRPALRNRASFPKAYVHLIGGFAATLAAVTLIHLPGWCALVIAIAAIGFEITQRNTVDFYDIAAGWFGIGLACLVWMAGRW